jgi:steroid 5-alpha reductase family enzyme
MTNQNRSLLGIVVSLAIGALVVLAGSDGSSMVGSIAVFAVCGLLAYVINWMVFVPSNMAKTERYFDLTGSATYVIVVAVALLLSDELDARAMIVGAMVVVWALRLGSFLFRRVRRDGRDGRFDEIKIDPLRFFMTWTLQGLWVLLTTACALAIITGIERQAIRWVAIVGIVVWVAGFAIEVVADRQKSAFKRDPANEGQFITSGIWAWSRHPNYFGEIVLWTGIAIMALPVLSGWRWITLISPVFVILLLTRVSGIPMLETRAEKRWGNEEQFQKYTRADSPPSPGLVGPDAQTTTFEADSGLPPRWAGREPRLLPGLCDGSVGAVSLQRALLGSSDALRSSPQPLPCEGFRRLSRRPGHIGPGATKCALSKVSRLYSSHPPGCRTVQSVSSGGQFCLSWNPVIRLVSASATSSAS